MASRRFKNPWPHESQNFGDILKWKLGLGIQEKPLLPDAGNHAAGWRRIRSEDIAAPPVNGWKITWLGHASFLVQGMGISLLIDPIFSDYCSPIPFPSLRRKVPPPCEIADLPEIHAVLLTHSHYDHLDLATLKSLGANVPLIVPEGHAGWLREKKHFRNVREIPWHQGAPIGAGVTVTATPAQHFTARSFTDRNLGHWCGWLVEGGGQKIWHAGDSGYCPAFREIGERYGPIDFGMIPIGAYQPRAIMKAMHMNPEEAVQAFEDARCKRAAAMHWGTFVLTGEPPLRLQNELARRSLSADCFVAGEVGESWQI